MRRSFQNVLRISIRAVLLVFLARPGCAEEARIRLFDGKTLEGWVQRGGKALYTVEEGAIVGTSVRGTPNSFLCTEKRFANFILELEFQVDPGLNSGVQIRSNSLPDYKNGRVHGYQVEIDPSKRAWTGGIYDEGRRGWLNDLKNNAPARNAFKQGQWNHLRVEAMGNSIQTWVNRVPAADLTDDMTAEGFIALQVHSTGSKTPKHVRFRNIWIVQLKALPPAEPPLAAAWRAVAAYTAGHSRKPLLIIEATLKAASEDERATGEDKLLDVLANPRATLEGKQFACRMLRLIGTRESLPALTAMLPEPDLSDMARYALGAMPYPEVDAALRAALNGPLPNPIRIGLINMLGAREDRQAVSRLAALSADPDPNVAQAAFHALGRIATEEAAVAILQANPPDALLEVKASALLNCARAALDAGRIEAAKTLFHPLTEADRPVVVRVAAYRGLVDALGGDSLPVILGLLDAPEAGLRRAAGPLLSDVKGARITERLMALLKTTPYRTQAIILGALADRGDETGMAAVVHFLWAPDEDVRLAAIGATARLGNGDHVPRLVKIAAEDGQFARAASRALAELSAKGVDEALAAVLCGDSAPRERAASVRALMARGTRSAVPALLQVAKRTDDTPLRRECLKALRSLAGGEHLADLLDLLLSLHDKTDWREAKKTIVVVGRRLPSPEARRSLLLHALRRAPAALRPTCLSLLGIFGGPRAREALTRALQDPDEACRYTAIKALADWDEPSPAQALLAFAGKTENEIHHVLALRGYVRLVGLGDGSPAEEETKALYQAALGVARRPEERDLIRAAMLALKVSDPQPESGKAYEIVGKGFGRDRKVYIDREYVFVDIPAVLRTADHIKTAMEDKYSKGNEFLSFTISRPATVYVCYDSRGKTPPAWLSGWKKTSLAMSTTDRACKLMLFSKRFPEAGRVVLGGNSAPGVAAMYTVGVTASPAE